MTYSPNNQDLSWQTPSRWTHTWLGNLEKPVSVENDPVQMPFSYRLSQNYPNPFNPVTTIEYSLKTAGRVNVAIFNILGQKVQTLVDEHKPAGEYSIKFDGARLSSGVYLYKIQAGDFVDTKKMVIMK